jgi:tight adherence protein B
MIRDPITLGLIAAVALAGAAACWAALAAPEFPAVASAIAHRALAWLDLEQARTVLAQAELGWLSPGAWVAIRWGLSALAGLLAYLLLGLIVIGPIAFLTTYHLFGLSLEARRLRAEERRQRALLDAVRAGIGIMSRAGGALNMLEALRDSGPFDSRRIFRELLADASSGGAASLHDAVRRMRERLADPLFDDLSLALGLHLAQGGKLVPALEAVAEEWTETLQLHRDAKAARAGVEASVLVLTALPWALLLLIHWLSPILLRPLSQPAGEVFLALAVGWMVIGFRVIQRMAAPPIELRMKFREEAGL